MNCLMIINVMEGTPSAVNAKFTTGLVIGLILTVSVGLITRGLYPPEESLVHWSLGLLLTSVGGSYAYWWWEVVQSVNQVVSEYCQSGALGYLEGALTGLCFLGVMITYSESRG
jgi:hypothetical protein